MSYKQNIPDNIPCPLTSTPKYHEPKLYEPKYHDKPYRILHMQNEFWFAACDWLPALGYTNYKNYLKSIPTEFRRCFYINKTKQPIRATIRADEMFRIIQTNKKPNTEAFKQWIKTKIIPHIQI